MIRKILLAALLWLPLMALAQNYPSPTFQAVQVNSGAGSLVKALNTAQAVTGTTSANCTTTTGIVYPCVNLFYIASDNADASSAPGPVMDGWQFAHNFGGSSLKGGRQVLDVIGNFTAPSNAANTLPGYVGIVGELITNSGDNGTAPTLVNGRGSFFAMNPVVVANSGAQNLFGIAGAEVNIQCNGCSTAIRYGVSVVQNGSSQGSILANDAAFHVGNQVAGGAFHQALNISNANGQAPLDSTGCVICTDSTANTIATGIDLSAYTISGFFLKGPSGFLVSGAGALTAPGGIGSSGGLSITGGGGAITGGLTVSGGTTTVAALTANGVITPTSTIGIKGTTTNDSPAAGNVGENPSQLTTGTSLSNNVTANCSSKSLTAGDWEVSGTVKFAAAAGTTIQALDAGISTTSATLGATGTASEFITAFSTGTTSYIPTPVVDLQLSTTTTVFLVGAASFGVSTMTCDGLIRARRLR